MFPSITTTAFLLFSLFLLHLRLQFLPLIPTPQFFHDFNCFLTVPIEIRARGIEAELAYRDAVLEGKVKVCRARLLIIGQDRAGKTSLKKSLLGLPFNPDEPSTEVLEVNPSKFDFTVEQVVDWKAVDSNEDKQARPEDRSVARLVASNMTKEKTNEKQVSPKKEKMKIDEEHAIEPTQVYKS